MTAGSKGFQEGVFSPRTFGMLPRYQTTQVTVVVGEVKTPCRQYHAPKWQWCQEGGNKFKAILIGHDTARGV